MIKSLYISRHALRRMHLYDISTEQVSKTIYEPEKVVSSVKERYNAYRRIGERVFRVTYREELTRYIVVTVTPRKSFKGKL